MKYMNISGKVDVQGYLVVDEYLENVEKNELVKEYHVVKNLDGNGKFKLGVNEFEYTFGFFVGELWTKVNVHLQLSSDGTTVEVIETFTGEPELFDVKEYEEILYKKIKETTGVQVIIELNITGYSEDIG